MIEATLIAGLTLVLLGTLALMRDIAGRGRSPLWFLLPLVGLRYVQEHFAEVWWAALMRVLGVALVLIGLGLALVRDPLLLQSPLRLFASEQGVPMLAGSQRADLNTFVSSEDAIRIAIRNDDNPRLSGNLNGQPFVYDRVELVNGVLTAQQGDGFLSDLSVRIMLHQDPLPITQRRTVLVRPDDPSPPEIHVSWRTSDSELPETRIIRSGYRMELQLAPLDNNRLTGFLQLILPDTRRSFLSGDFTAHTNRLRYVDGRVDVTFDHVDTLNYLVREHLHGQFPEGAVQEMRILETRMQRRESTATSRVRVVLFNGRIEERLLHLTRAEVGWSVRPGRAEVIVIEEGEQGGLRRVESAPRSTHKEEASAPPRPITQPFHALDQYEGRQVRMTRTDGSRQTGIIRGMSRERLLLETTVGSGTLSYAVSADEVRMLELADGQRIYIEGSGPVPDEQGVPEQTQEETPDGAADSAAADAPEEALPFSEYLGRQVRVHGRDGRQRTGVVTHIGSSQLTLEVPVGSGTLEYYYRYDEIADLEQVSGQ
ncbi:hypothetical protein [Isoalcanivorax indicus]|uniref:hypothetical protein n=1 Tax=Isoalcanivorax indicus TaxID=2202653 RepID=UPI000DB9EC27|nr:hypothetical protein [Isoalcanivorax indicus]